MHIIFMGTPAFALPALEALLGSAHTIIAVYTQPPRPAGRGQRDMPSPVHRLAAAHGIPVYTPVSLKDEAAQKEFAALEADVAAVVAYGLLLPEPILRAPKHGCINIHPSLLPRWRGAAPIQRTLMAGDTETGVAIMQMDAGLDTGGVLAQERCAIPPEMDAGALHDTLAAVGARLLLKTLEGDFKSTPQSVDGVTYAKKITKEDGRIDWSQPARHIANQVRGLSPSPGAFFELSGEAVKLFKVQVEAGAGTPGTVLDDRLLVACGEGALRLLELQRPGKKRMAAKDFLAGAPVSAHQPLTANR